MGAPVKPQSPSKAGDHGNLNRGAKTMKAYLGDYVTEKAHRNIGRVCHIALGGFYDSGCTKEWLRIQEVPFTEDELYEEWYTILCQDGGSVWTCESRVRVLENVIMDNAWEKMYFRDVNGIVNTQGTPWKRISH